MKTGRKSYYEWTVMLDRDVLNTSGDGCPECNDLEEGRCELCQAWAEEVSKEIEERVFERFTDCSVIWLWRSDMGSYAAAYPYCMSCPDNIYEAVLGK